MVDTTDSKSVALKGVGVRLPPLLPTNKGNGFEYDIRCGSFKWRF